jgi:hypothetical protein
VATVPGDVSPTPNKKKTLFLYINYPAAIKVLVQTGYNPMTVIQLVPLYAVTVIGSILKFQIKGGYPK